MLGNPDSKPHFFSDKALEPITKGIVKKFPLMDTKSSSVSHILYTLYCSWHCVDERRTFLSTPGSSNYLCCVMSMFIAGFKYGLLVRIDTGCSLCLILVVWNCCSRHLIRMTIVGWTVNCCQCWLLFCRPVVSANTDNVADSVGKTWAYNIGWLCKLTS